MRSPARHFLRGHTLPELLVAIAILCLLVVLIFQVIEEVLHVTQSQEQKIEATASGRRLLDVMAVDLENAVIGSDATVIAPMSPTNVLLAMLCNRRAPTSASTSRFLAVKYAIDSSNRVYRSYGAVGFSRTNLMEAALNASTNPVTNAAIPLASGILAVQARAFTARTNYPVSSAPSPNWAVTNSYRGQAIPSGYNALVTASSGYGSSLTNCTRSLEISVAAIDAADYALIRSTGYLASVKTALAGDPIGWKVALDNLAMPPRIKSAIRILQKTTPLP
jgi:prepilin-type N-terminal cleavage/methylation domain-containing protein